MKRHLLFGALTLSAVAITAAPTPAPRNLYEALKGDMHRMPHPTQGRKRTHRAGMAAAGYTADRLQRMMARRQMPAEGIWRPQSSIVQYPMGEDTWVEGEIVKTEYDASGRPVKVAEYDPEEALYYVATLSYSDDDLTTTAILMTGETEDALVPAQKQVRSVDSRMTDLVVEASYYDWDEAGEEWTLGFPSYKRTVDRDVAGNVTAIHYFTLYEDEMEEVQKIGIEYGTDGKPESVTEYILSYNEHDELEWIEAYSYRDCTWYATEGQIWDMDSIFEGSNRIKSYSQYESDMLIASMEVTFAENTDNFTCTAIYDDGTASIQEWENHEYGGYSNFVSFYESEEEMEEPLYSFIEHEEYDFLDNVKLAYSLDIEMGMPFVESWLQGEYEYDTTGLPTVYTLRSFIPEEEDWEEEEPWEGPDAEFRKASRSIPSFAEPPSAGTWENEMRILYSDYTDCSAAMPTVTVDSDGAAEYYSIDGHRLASPYDKGIYIRRQGSNATKHIGR